MANIEIWKIKKQSTERLIYFTDMTGRQYKIEPELLCHTKPTAREYVPPMWRESAFKNQGLRA